MLYSLARGLLIAACCVAGALFIVVGSLSAWERYRTESWAARQAMVTKSELSWTMRNGHRRWYPKIEVRFLDDGEEVPVQVAYGRWLGWNDQIRQTAEEDVSRYPAGREVPVFHAPGNPGQAVLERHSWMERAGLVPLGVVMLAVPFRAMRARRRTADTLA